MIGDFGTATSYQYAVAAQIKAREPELDALVTTGDNIYPDGSSPYFDSNFFSPFRCVFRRDIQIHAALGNHDVATENGNDELAEPAFGMPARNYVIRRGGVRFVIADSNSLDRSWLRGALDPEEGDRWTVVLFHHPVYSPGTHGSTAGFRPGLPRMFRRHGVDLVLNGHDHLYSVSKSLRGIRYVVTGGGGANLYECSRKWFTQVCKEQHHYLEVVVEDDHLRARAVPPEGRPIDVFTTTGRN